MDGSVSQDDLGRSEWHVIIIIIIIIIIIVDRTRSTHKHNKANVKKERKKIN